MPNDHPHLNHDGKHLHATGEKVKGANFEERGVQAIRGGFYHTLVAIKRWASEHKSEIFWAAIFAILVAWIFDPPKPQPFTIYILADPRTEPETMAVFESLERNAQADPLTLGDVPVQVKLEKLDAGTTDAAIAKASELANRPDTLMVIGHLPSPLIEASLPTYFQAIPPIPFLSTTASDEDLLINCEHLGTKCMRDGLFAPLLQLSPTNQDQGRAAIRFATQHGKRRFMIVSENDFTLDTYTKDLIQAYHDAIAEFNVDHKQDGDLAEIVGKYRLSGLPDKAELRKSDPDCVLYAGELEVAHGLLHSFSDPQPLVILSDSSLESRLSDNALRDFILVRFTYQTDAEDYNDHTNIYGLDAYSIAKQLIADLNTRGGDLRYRLKTLLHFHYVNDARRSLVRVMKDNSIARTWYRGTPDQGEPGTPYLFDHHRRVAAIFHVWQLKDHAAKPGSQMVDVDNWHPPRVHSSLHESATVAAK